MLTAFVCLFWLAQPAAGLMCSQSLHQLVGRYKEGVQVRDLQAWVLRVCAVGSK